MNIEEEKNNQQTVAEEAVQQEEAPATESRRRNRRTRKRPINKQVILGAVIMVFAVIGLVSTVIFIGRGTYDLIDNKAQKQEFAQFIFPLVILDPPPFDSVDKLEETTALTASVWNLLKNEDLSKYPQDEFGFITVPQTDVDAYAAKLFGPDLKLTHQSLGDAEYSFDYDETGKNYIIPSSPSFPSYTPQVTEIKRNQDTYRLTVDYLPSGSLWSQDVDGKKYEPDPAKTLIYVLKKSSSGYRITAVEAIKDDSSSSSGVASQAGQDVSSELASSEQPTSSAVGSENGSSESVSDVSSQTGSGNSSQESTSSQMVSSGREAPHSAQRRHGFAPDNRTLLKENRREIFRLFFRACITWTEFCKKSHALCIK